MGIFKKRKAKKQQKQFAKSMDLEVPVENTGNFFYMHWGIISIIAAVLTSIPFLLVGVGVLGSINFGLWASLVIVIPGTLAIIGYIFYYKDKKRRKGGFKS